jgi:hypothetical protein
MRTVLKGRLHIDSPVSSALLPLAIMLLRDYMANEPGFKDIGNRQEEAVRDSHRFIRVL